MKILPVKIHNSKTSFRSCDRVYKPQGHKAAEISDTCEIRTYTNIFRTDIDWTYLVKYMQSHFANKEKVNIYSLACSDGSEPYSLAMVMKENMPENLLNKFLPIKASDIDNNVIDVAKNGRLNVYPIEFLIAENHCDMNLLKYLKDKKASVIIEGDSLSETDYIYSYKISDEISKMVNFKVSDILTELENIKDEGNSVVMCRNVFPYLKQNYIDKIIDTARKVLKPDSLFIIGNFDETRKLSQKLIDKGFYYPLVNQTNIFTLGNKTNAYSRLINVINS